MAQSISLEKDQTATMSGRQDDKPTNARLERDQRRGSPALHIGQIKRLDRGAGPVDNGCSDGAGSSADSNGKKLAVGTPGQTCRVCDGGIRVGDFCEQVGRRGEKEGVKWGDEGDEVSVWGSGGSKDAGAGWVIV